MFINVSNFKKLCKNAYDGIGLQIGCSEDGEYTIGCEWWYLNIHKDDITKKAYAAVAELVGILPILGEAMEFRKGTDSKPIAKVFPDLDELWGRLTDYHIANVMLKTPGTMSQVLEGAQENILIPYTIIQTVDPSKTECDENHPGNPRSGKEFDWVVWQNNVMTFGCRKRPCRYIGEKEFMTRIQGADLTWEWKESDCI